MHELLWALRDRKSLTTTLGNLIEIREMRFLDICEWSIKWSSNEDFVLPNE